MPRRRGRAHGMFFVGHDGAFCSSLDLYGKRRACQRELSSRNGWSLQIRPQRSSSTRAHYDLAIGCIAAVAPSVKCTANRDRVCMHTWTLDMQVVHKRGRGYRNHNRKHLHKASGRLVGGLAYPQHCLDDAQIKHERYSC